MTTTSFAPLTSTESPVTVSLTTLLTSTTALGAALVGGVFFTFSGFVMPALARVDVRTGVTTMQSINVTAVRPPLMVLLFGTAVLCLVTVWRAVATWGTPAAPWLLAGSAVYLVGVIGVTAAANVPLNDALALLDPAGSAAPAQWAHYLSRWTAWNHVRTLAGLASAAAFLVARLR